MNVSFIVAVAANNVIGKDNRLIWHLPADMKFFRDTTMGHCVITGRKNYESIPDKFRPLSGRTNIVVTRDKSYQAPGATVVHSVEEALAKAKAMGEPEAFIIGGADIFKQTLPLADTIYLTEVHHSFDGDVHFPVLDKKEWKEIKREERKADEKNAYDLSFVTLVRSNS